MRDDVTLYHRLSLAEPRRIPATYCHTVEPSYNCNLTLHWCQKTVIAFHISDNLTVCSTVWSGKEEMQHEGLILVLFQGRPLVAGGFPSQRASYMESVPMSWHHHQYMAHLSMRTDNGSCLIWGHSLNVAILVNPFISASLYNRQQ